jgi:hypothetical protein
MTLGNVAELLQCKLEFDCSLAWPPARAPYSTLPVLHAGQLYNFCTIDRTTRVLFCTVRPCHDRALPNRDRPVVQIMHGKAYCPGWPSVQWRRGCCRRADSGWLFNQGPVDHWMVEPRHSFLKEG